MGIYDTKVKERLGDKTYNAILECVINGQISNQKLTDFAQQLGQSISGNQSRRDKCDEAAMREVLSDWWNVKLFKLGQNEALDKLIEVFKTRPVYLPPLANRLSEFRRCNLSQSSEVQAKIDTEKRTVAGTSSATSAPLAQSLPEEEVQSPKLPLSKIMERAITSEEREDRKFAFKLKTYYIFFIRFCSPPCIQAWVRKKV